MVDFSFLFNFLLLTFYLLIQKIPTFAIGWGVVSVQLGVVMPE